MHKARYGIMAIIAALLAAAMASASSWEGSAIMGSYGDFPSSGYFAACNSFSRNTSVEVTNLENGRRVTVVVTRGVDSPGIFMMLSVEAADALGIGSGRVARVRASEPRSALELSPGGRSRAADPDFNPRILAEAELRRLGYVLEPTPTPSAPAPAAAAPVAPPAAAAQAAETAVAAPAAPAQASPAPLEPSSAPERPSVVDKAPVGPGLAAEAPGLAESPAPNPPPAAAPPAAPVPVNGPRPKPVRTVILPQLPEPATPALAAPAPTPAPPLAAAAPESEPLAFTIPMPKPDEAPIRFELQARPRTFEAPALMPELSGGRLRAAEPLMPLVFLPGADAPLASVQSAEASASRLRAPGDDTRLSLSEAPPPPRATADSTRLPLPAELWPRIVLAEAVAPDSASIAAAADEGEGAVAERIAPALTPPDAPDLVLSAPDLRLSADERAEALARTAPNRARGAPAPALAWPELEADELPQALLSRIDSPVMRIPELKLAMVEMPAIQAEAVDETPSIVAKSAPSMAAAETRLEFVQGLIEAQPETPAATEARPQPEPRTQPSAVLADATPPAAEPSSPAAEAPAAEAPVSPASAAEAPAETIITLEPTGPRPPQGVPPAMPAPAPATPPAPAASPAPAIPPAAAASPPIGVALMKGGFYIQVAAFRSVVGANDAVAGLVLNGHAALVESLADARGAVWRVYVGPLSRDEAGVALMRVRALGYRDAFVKQGG